VARSCRTESPGATFATPSPLPRYRARRADTLGCRRADTHCHTRPPAGESAQRASTRHRAPYGQSQSGAYATSPLCAFDPVRIMQVGGFVSESLRFQRPPVVTFFRPPATRKVDIDD